jgi:hypothetical protein
VSVYWRGALVDERTADMMDEVVRLVGPGVNVRPTQGSYTGGVSASAGTHNGCGALDLAGQDSGMTQGDREAIRNAQRQVGFASWIRDPSQSDWPWHIHCEAVQPGGKWDQGCLSSGAHGQVVDYFEGRNGLASGAADDGPRQWVGVTWETYQGAKPPPEPEHEEDEVPIFMGTTASEGGRIYMLMPNRHKYWLNGQEWALMARLYPYWADMPGSPFLEVEVDMVNAMIQPNV